MIPGVTETMVVATLLPSVAAPEIVIESPARKPSAVNRLRPSMIRSGLAAASNERFVPVTLTPLGVKVTLGRVVPDQYGIALSDTRISSDASNMALEVAPGALLSRQSDTPPGMPKSLPSASAWRSPVVNWVSAPRLPKSTVIRSRMGCANPPFPSNMLTPKTASATLEGLMRPENRLVRSVTRTGILASIGFVLPNAVVGSTLNRSSSIAMPTSKSSS